MYPGQKTLYDWALRALVIWPITKVGRLCARPHLLCGDLTCNKGGKLCAGSHLSVLTSQLPRPRIDSEDKGGAGGLLLKVPEDKLLSLTAERLAGYKNAEVSYR